MDNTATARSRRDFPGRHVPAHEGQNLSGTPPGDKTNVYLRAVVSRKSSRRAAAVMSSTAQTWRFKRATCGYVVEGISRA